MTLERYNRRTRRFHAAVYLVILPLLFTGWWLLAGREGEPSPLARAVSQPDATIHQWLGWALAALALLPLTLGRRGLSTFARETFRFDTGDATWLARWPGAIISGRFARHEGHFDPGQRTANIVIVVSLIALLASGVGLVVVPGGPAFVWLHRVHTWATVAVTPVLVGHVLIALGVLPGYSGVWQAMHLGGRVPVETAWRIWPGWTERSLTGSKPTGDVGQDAGQIYVADQRTGTLAVLDPASNVVVAMVTVGEAPFGVAVAPDQAHAYVTNVLSGTISVIQIATNAVVATIPVGSAPFGLAVTPDGTRLYVATAGDNAISVVDTASNTVVGSVAAGTDPFGVSASPDGAHVYVASVLSQTVSVLDTSTNSVVATVRVASSPFGVAVTPDGAWVYVAGQDPCAPGTGNGTVSVLDTATNTIVATIPVEVDPRGVAVGSDGARVYVTNRLSQDVSVIDTAENTVVASVGVGSDPSAVTVSSDGARAYVTNLGSGTVSVIDTATNTVVATVPIGIGQASDALASRRGGPFWL